MINDQATNYLTRRKMKDYITTIKLLNSDFKKRKKNTRKKNTEKKNIKYDVSINEIMSFALLVSLANV